MPIYTLRIGDRTYSINSRGKRSALIFARSMLTEDMAGEEVVVVTEDEDQDGFVIFEATVGGMLGVDAGHVRGSA